MKGCKTGITMSAGPCFSGYVERNQGPNLEHIIVIVLNSKSMEARWVEIPQLVNWFLAVKEKAISELERVKGGQASKQTIKLKQK
jgi:D-alanyl-D-alanine carboxypeptidase